MGVPAHSAFASGHMAMTKRTRAPDPIRLLARATFAALVAMSSNYPAQAQSRLWYYCSATHEFYPYTQSCSVPWRAVRPYNAVPLGQPHNLVPQPDQPGSYPQDNAQTVTPPADTQEQGRSDSPTQDNAAPDLRPPQDQPDTATPQDDQGAATPAQAPEQSDRSESESSPPPPPPTLSSQQQSASVAPTREEPPAQASANPVGDNASANIVFLLLAAALFLALITTPHFFKLYLKRVRGSKIRAVTYATVMQHKLALQRKRTQNLLKDDFGVLITKKWYEVIDHFIDRVLDPEIKPLGQKTYAQYRTMRPAVFQEIEDIVERLPKSENTADLAPNLTGVDYEHYCAEQLRKAGWDARTTKASGDMGGDVIAEKYGRRLVVQCKYWNNSVGVEAVQQVVAARMHEQADFAAVASKSPYTPNARQLAATTGVLLLCHSDLEHIDEILAAPPATVQTPDVLASPLLTGANEVTLA